MTEAPRFTFLMPTHGRADVIGASIRSLLGQTRQDFELIVVGDGCKDETAHVVASFNDPRILWLDFEKGPNMGYGNRNKGLARARGEIICFAQHDDLTFPDHLHQMDMVFRRKDAMWAYSRPLWVADDGVVVPFFVNLKSRGGLPDWADINNIPSNCVAVRREAFEKVGYFDETLAMAGDIDLWKRIVRHFGPGAIAFVREPTGLHFRNLWRSGPASWGPSRLGYLLTMARTSYNWPPQLKLDVGDAGKAPQLSIGDRLQNDAPQLVNQLRIGCHLLQDQLAWAATAHPLG